MDSQTEVCIFRVEIFLSFWRMRSCEAPPTVVLAGRVQNVERVWEGDIKPFVPQLHLLQLEGACEVSRGDQPDEERHGRVREGVEQLLS